MRIAILGTRGIPANYGGFETFAEECATGLAARGHDVTVYCRSHYVSSALKTHRGARLVVLPTLEWKYTDTIVHTFLSVLHAVTRRYDAILICNAANSIFAAIPRLFGIPVAVNVDGIERLRRKWNRLAKAYYHLSEYLSTRIPNVIVTDARIIREYYLRNYGAESVYIPYGTRITRPEGIETLERLGLVPNEYFLYVSRFEPENNAHQVVAAFEKTGIPMRLVLVGDAPYAPEYIKKIKSTRDPRILFPGAIYGPGYWQLQANAFCYVHATEVGGIHPALVEAMGQGNLIIANGTPENAEALEGAGLLYRKNDVDDLARRMREVAEHPEAVASLKVAAMERARTVYSWDSVVGAYEQLFSDMIKMRRS
ncbi:MAG: glycosyltransferase family 1 protein [Acidobacteria bacterium]|nr:glycosyltransferase family 1 protein [Acidobacteriota bacterium]